MKDRIEELAVFGYAPTFTDKLHVGRPNIGNRKQFINRVEDLLETRWLTNNGPYVQEFEQRIAKIVGAKHCIATCNATIALEITIRALELSGEVIVPSFTFIATAHALYWLGITPIFCDIDPLDHNVNPYSVERMINPYTTGIIAVHMWGRPCNVDEISRISQQYKLKLIFDAAHAFGTSHCGHMIGNFGDAEIFSFHATKFLNTFEGGAVITNNDSLATKIRLMRNFGLTGDDYVAYVGTNGKMSEVSAAMGLTGLECMNDFISCNYMNYKCYQKELANIPGIKLLLYDKIEKYNYQYIVLEIDETITQLNRDQIMKVLWEENILARRYFYPGCHYAGPYYSYYFRSKSELLETSKIAARVLLLPTGTAIGPEEISAIGQIIRLVVKNGSALQKLLSENL